MIVRKLPVLFLVGLFRLGVVSSDLVFMRSVGFLMGPLSKAETPVRMNRGFIGCSGIIRLGLSNHLIPAMRNMVIAG
jgi:hypothetical protein